MAAEEFIAKIPSLQASDLLAEPITPLSTLKAEASIQMKYKMELFITHLQAVIVKKLQQYEPVKTFFVDKWHRQQGGGGITCVLQEGEMFEKAGVNISVVWGELHGDQVRQMKSRGKDLHVDGVNSFFATGISSVIHPINPYCPTIHFNYRYFEVVNENTQQHTWWFGGGTDMTPTYLSEKDAVHFHQVQKDACDKHHETYYPRFKKWADDYFFSPHRGEHRGVGGLFFDDLDEGGIDKCFSFVASCAYAILPAIIPIFEEHKNDDYGDKHAQWQQLRRGRYVEFNLVHDRGTKFGLATPGARIESILMSLPLTARWEYMHEVKEGSEEEKIMSVLKKPRDWL